MNAFEKLREHAGLIVYQSSVEIPPSLHSAIYAARIAARHNKQYEINAILLQYSKFYDSVLEIFEMNGELLRSPSGRHLLFDEWVLYSVSRVENQLGYFKHEVSGGDCSILDRLAIITSTILDLILSMDSDVSSDEIRDDLLAHQIKIDDLPFL